eukprot:sb/3474112/
MREGEKNRSETEREREIERFLEELGEVDLGVDTATIDRSQKIGEKEENDRGKGKTGGEGDVRERTKGLSSEKALEGGDWEKWTDTGAYIDGEEKEGTETEGRADEKRKEVEDTKTDAERRSRVAELDRERFIDVDRCLDEIP